MTSFHHLITVKDRYDAVKGLVGITTKLDITGEDHLGLFNRRQNLFTICHRRDAFRQLHLRFGS